jgi:hypothetical protein
MVGLEGETPALRHHARIPCCRLPPAPAPSSAILHVCPAAKDGGDNEIPEDEVPEDIFAGEEDELRPAAPVEVRQPA